MHTDKLVIRPAMKEEFPAIWPMFREVAQSAESYPYPPDIDQVTACDLWFQPGAHVYIAELGGDIVATRYIVPNKVGLGSHICNTGVIISSHARGKGLGSTMMEFAIAEATRLGFQAIQLNLVVCKNNASIKICKRYGFDIIGTIPKGFFYKQREYVDAYIMYKAL